jgi:hypothetical protein
VMKLELVSCSVSRSIEDEYGESVFTLSLEGRYLRVELSPSGVFGTQGRSRIHSYKCTIKLFVEYWCTSVYQLTQVVRIQTLRPDRDKMSRVKTPGHVSMAVLVSSNIRPALDICPYAALCPT